MVLFKNQNIHIQQNLVSGQPVINFSEAPDANGRISIVYLGNEILTATSATSSTHIDEFNGNGSTTAFTLTRTPAANNAANFVVFVDNVYQRYGSSYAYTVVGDVRLHLHLLPQQEQTIFNVFN